MLPRTNQTFSYQQNIWIVTNYGEFKSSPALKMGFRKNFKLSPRQLPHSYAFSRVINRFIASGDISSFNLPDQNYRRKHWYSIETWSKKSPTLPFLRRQQQWTCLRVLCGRFWGKHWENIQLNLKLFKVLQILQLEGHLSSNWNPTREDLLVNFLLQIFSLEMSYIRQYK